MFKNKTVFITGGSRGIGKAIGLKLASAGANVAIAAKTVEPHPLLPGTIHSAAEEMDSAGGKGLALKMDLRHEDEVKEAVIKTVETFGGIDILINNASAISLTSTKDTTMKRFDLMYQVNVRGTFLATQLCSPHLLKAENPHVLTLAPPVPLSAKWFAGAFAYTYTKYGMSLAVYGMAEEFRGEIAFNALWPRTIIATAAVQNLLGGDAMIRKSRKPEIVGDAAFEVLKRDFKKTTGNFFIDEDILREAGVSDFSSYSVDPTEELQLDLFLE